MFLNTKIIYFSLTNLFKFRIIFFSFLFFLFEYVNSRIFLPATFYKIYSCSVHARKYRNIARIIYWIQLTVFPFDESMFPNDRYPSSLRMRSTVQTLNLQLFSSFKTLYETALLFSIGTLFALLLKQKKNRLCASHKNVYK